MRFGGLGARRSSALNFAMDRGLFEALNGFDERFVGWGYEDSDLRDRAMRLGRVPG